MEDWTRPGKNSLRLLPFGPDRVGDNPARANLPRQFLSKRASGCKDKSNNLAILQKIIYQVTEMEAAVAQG